MIPALVVYVLAVLTVFSVMRCHVLSESERGDAFYTFLVCWVAVWWPFYLPAVAFDWALDRRAARGGR